ncbi:g protein-coupled receptor-related [Anaeramoeba flamelloides]|uniref:G protein-coupled receptor-related n=1 Tax=Anaeramoeba flamelloides TaxID=1746091 RepID=A0AAV8A9V7_9EUKA|nr:g protein-coupled receptor-related [Anaeramoeba flamelloides]
MKITAGDYSILEINSPNVEISNTEFNNIYCVDDSYSVTINFDSDQNTEALLINSSTLGRVKFTKGILQIEGEVGIDSRFDWVSGILTGDESGDQDSYTLIINGDFQLHDENTLNNDYQTIKKKIEYLNVRVGSGNLIKWGGYESLLLANEANFLISDGCELLINGSESVAAPHYVSAFYSVANSKLIIEEGAYISFYNDQTILPKTDEHWGFVINGDLEVRGNSLLENGYFTIGDETYVADQFGINYKCNGEYQNYGEFYIAEDAQGIYQKGGNGDLEGKFQNYGKFGSKIDEIGTTQEYYLDVKFINSDNESSLVIGYDTTVHLSDYSQESTSEIEYLKSPYLLIKKNGVFNASVKQVDLKQGTIRGEGLLIGDFVNTGAVLWPGLDRNNPSVYEFKTLSLKGSYSQVDKGKYRIYIYNQERYEKLKILPNDDSNSQIFQLDGLLDIVFLYPFVLQLNQTLNIIDLDDVKSPFQLQLGYDITNVPPNPLDRVDPSQLELSQRFWKTIDETGTPGESDYDPYDVQPDDSSVDYYQKEMHVTTFSKSHYQDYFHEFTYYNGTDEQESLYGIIIRALGCPPGKKYESSYSDCINCDRGKYSQDYSSAECQFCAAGTYSSDQGSCTCKQCGMGTYSAEGSAECNFCPADQYNDKEGQSECIDCPQNTIAEEKGAQSIDECLCEEYFYEQDGDCVECPFGGLCDSIGTENPNAEIGFWNSTAGSKIFYSCIPKEACVGNGQCSDNYEGRLCGVCKPNTYRLGYFCVSCGKEKIGWRIFAFLIIFAFVCYFFYYFASKDYPTVIYFTTITILLSFLQEISFLSLFDLNWPKSLLALFDFLSVFSLNIDLFGSECYNSSWTFVNKFILALFVPLLFTISYYLYYLGASVWSYYLDNKIERIKGNHQKWFDSNYEYQGKMKSFKRAYHILRRKLFNFRNMDELYLLSKNIYNAYTFLLSFIYIFITYWVLRPMDCTKYDETGFSIFDPEPQYSCEGARYGVLLAFSIIFCIVYVAGIPLWMYYQFQKNINRITFREEYGLLIGRFKDRFYYWEIVIMCRRLIFVMLALFLSRYPMMQTAFAEMALFLMLLLQLYVKPFKDERHNRLELVILASRVFISLGGTLFYSSDIESDNIYNLLTALVFIVFSISIIIFVVIIWYDKKMNKQLMQEKAAEREELEKHLLSSGENLNSPGDNERKVNGKKVWKTMEILRFLKEDSVPKNLLGWLLQADKEQRERFADIAIRVIEYALEQSSKVGKVQLNELNGINQQESESNPQSTSGDEKDEIRKNDDLNSNSDQRDVEEIDEFEILGNDQEHIKACINCWEEDLLPLVADILVYWIDDASVLEKRSLSVLFRSLDIFMRDQSNTEKIKYKLKKIKQKITRMVKSNSNDDESISSTTGSSSTSSTTSSSTTTSSESDELELKEIEKNQNSENKTIELD